MRWFVEVSRVGESGSDEKYCVEAKQWQAALQEARKLRGDSGPLSKFSIELLDDGYRAVDPKLKLRFVVAKAPPDAELTVYDPAARTGSSPINGQPASPTAALSVAPPAAAPSVAPAMSAPTPSVAPKAVPSSIAQTAVSSTAAPAAAPKVVPSVAPPAVAPSVGAPKVMPSVAPAAVAPSVAAPKVAPSVAPPAVAPSVAPAAVAPSVAAPKVVPSVVPPAAAPAFIAQEPYAGVPSSALSPLAPAELDAKSPSAFPPRPGSARPPASPSGITVPADAIPAAPAVPRGLGPSVPQTHTQPSPAYELPPPSSVLRKRQEEPTPESPITYREVAYVVEPGPTRGAVEALLWASFKSISRELSDRPGQKFVQLAVFDHRFEKRPERPPLGTLAWKDWRGNPVITFPFFDGTLPARASVPAPANASAPAPSRASVTGPSIVPLPVVKVTSSAPPAKSPTVPPPAVAASGGGGASPTPSTSAPSTEVATGLAAVPAGAGNLAQSEPLASAIPLTREKLPSAPGTAREKLPSHPSGARASKPRMAAVRRRAGEDLIGELFETMHDLHFMSGVADGAEFMMETIDTILPCEGVLVHVFDINTRQFVIVRAKGPAASEVLLQRTPDSEPFFSAVMRRPGSVAIHDVAKDPRVLGPRWEALRVKPDRALCGPVRQGGRYLGLLEVVNPLGDAPFHQTEQNALDYVCQQFAEFLANRPIVLDADVILRR